MSTITTNLGGVTAYSDAVAAGYTGTKAEWQALMASYATVAETAQGYAADAQGYANDASGYASSASSSATTASNAKTAAERAQGYAEAAQTAAEGARDDVQASATQIDTNTTAIGTLSSLTTTAQTNLVAAVNEVDADVTTLNNQINQSNAVVFNDVGKFINFNPLYYWNIEGSTAVYTNIPDTGWYAGSAISVTSGDLYKVKACQGNTHKARIWVVTDDELNIVDMADDYYGREYHEDTITIPTGGTKLLITTTASVIGGTSPYGYLWKLESSVSVLEDKVDYDIDKIHSALNCKNIEIPLGMEIGGLGTDGEETESTIRVRSMDFIPVVMASPDIYFPEGTQHRILYYGDALAYITDWSDSSKESLTFSTDYTFLRVRILIGYTDNRVITADTIPTPKIKYFYNLNDGVPFVNGYAVYAYEPYPKIYFVSNVYNLSAIIPVEPSTTYRGNKIRNTFVFDSNMVFTRVLTASDTPNNQFTTTADEHYVVYTWKTTDCDVAYFEKVSDFVSGAEIENLVPVTLKGKYLSLLGDSISAYTGTIPSGNDVYYTGSNSGMDSSSQMWWSVLCDKLGMIPLVINGYSGSAVTQLEDSAHINKVPMSSDTRCSALDDGTNTPDVIIIAGGVNDYSYAQSAQSEPLSWDGKTTPVLGNSFTEAYACMIKKLQTNYPNAVIVCLSTWFTMRGDDNGYTLTHTVGNNVYTQQDYNDAIKFVAEQMHVPYIDVSNIGFNRSNFYPTYAQDSSTIPTHPNSVGQGVMGRAIANKLPELVKGFLK